jgi:t-SNARE complex subunit (syntaxin)
MLSTPAGRMMVQMLGEFFQDLRQTVDRPRQAVDAVDEQKVETVKASIAKGSLQLWSL